MILFLLSEAFNSLRRTKFSSFITIITTSIAIFFVTVSVFMILLSQKLDTKIKSQIKVNVFLEDSLNSNQIADLRKTIYTDSLVKAIKLISKEEAKQIFVRRTGRDFSTILEANPLPRSFVVSLRPEKLTGKKIDEFSKRISKLKGVSDVIYDYTLTVRMLHYLNSIKSFIYIAAIVLVLISLYLVYSTNRLAIQSRMDLFNTMKLVGAKLSTIKLPLMFNGLFIGIVSGLIATGIFVAFTRFLQEVNQRIKVVENEMLFGIFILGTGVILGLLGSYFATRKITLKI